MFESRTERLALMLPWLASNNGARIPDIAVRFGVSNQQVLADLALLTMTGPGQFGGELVDIYYDDEYASVINAQGLEAATRLEENEARLLAQTLLSLSDKLPESLATPIAVLINKIVSNNESRIKHFTIYDTHDDSILKVSEGLVNERVLTFDHFSEREGYAKKRVVSPYKFEISTQNTYLLGYCHDSKTVKTFALSRMSNVELTSERFISTAGKISPFQNDGKIEVLALIKKEIIPYLENYPNFEIAQEESGRVRISFCVYNREHLIRLGLRFIREMRILTPTDIEIEINQSINDFLL